MTEPMIIQRLEQWVRGLRQIESVELDLGMDPEEIQLRLEKRQQSINGLGQLDAFLSETAKWRRNGWPGLDEPTRIRAEDLIASALATCTRIMGNDQQIIEKAHEKRQSILARLAAAAKGKEYLASIPPAGLRPPVIVDDSV